MELIKPGTNIDFLGKRKVAIAISSVVTLVILLLIPFHLNMGVDFSGGTEIQVKFNEPVSATEVRQHIEGAGFHDANVQQFGDKAENSFLVRVSRVAILSPEQITKIRETLQSTLAPYGLQAVDIDQNVGDHVDIRTEKPVATDVIRSAMAQAGITLRMVSEPVRDLTRGGQPTYQVLTQSLSEKVTAAINQSFGAEKVSVERVEYVGPQAGKDLRNRGIMAVVLAMIAIVIYVAFRFQPKYAPGAIIALLHDLSIVMGFYVVTGHEFNLTSIAVLLTIVGYSINDTIVVFDRVREIESHTSGLHFQEILNRALNETLSRTVITVGVTALSLVGLLIFGVGTIWDFAAAMMVGLLAGTYSTVYIAGPFSVFVDNWMHRREQRKKALAGSSPAPQKPSSGKRRAEARAE